MVADDSVTATRESKNYDTKCDAVTLRGSDGRAALKRTTDVGSQGICPHTHPGFHAQTLTSAL